MKTIVLVVALLGSLVLMGCVKTVAGRSRAGIPFIKDKIEARYERSPMDIWQAGKDVLRYMGTLYSEDSLKSTLEASVNGRTVWIQVVPMDTEVTRVIIQTRTKGGGADLELAGEIDKQIAIRLASGNLTPFKPATSAP